MQQELTKRFQWLFAESLLTIVAIGRAVTILVQRIFKNTGSLIYVSQYWVSYLCQPTFLWNLCRKERDTDTGSVFQVSDFSTAGFWSISEGCASISVTTDHRRSASTSASVRIAQWSSKASKVNSTITS